MSRYNIRSQLWNRSLRPALSFLKKNAINPNFMRWEFVPETERNGFSALEFWAIRLFEDPGRQRWVMGRQARGKGMFALVPVNHFESRFHWPSKSEIRVFLSSKRSQRRGVISPLSILHLLMSSRRRGSSVFIVHEHWANSQSSSRSCPISLSVEGQGRSSRQIRELLLHADPLVRLKKNWS